MSAGHVWLIAGFVLAIVEMLTSGQVFLGLAIAAALMGLAILGGLWVGSTAGALVVTALLAAAVWLVLRRMAGVREGQVRLWHRDINDD